MKGIQTVAISNRVARYKFELRRNITIVRGDSGTGKTTLYNMVVDHYRLREASGVNVSSSCPLVALTDNDWRNQLSKVSGSIVFIDEGACYVTSRDFAEAIRHSDNYYVIFTRQSLHQLPYSVEEIYEIKSSGRYHVLKPLYMVKPGHYIWSSRVIWSRKANPVQSTRSI